MFWTCINWNMQIFFKKGLRADVWCNLAVLIRVLYHPQILVYHFWLPHAIPQFLSWHPMMLYMLSVAPQRHWPSLYVTINSLKASIKSVVQVLRHKAIQCMSSPFSPVLHTLPFFSNSTWIQHNHASCVSAPPSSKMAAMGQRRETTQI